MNDWDQDIYNLHDEQPQPERGSLLVAKPTVGDFFFKRSLVLIVDPDEGEGAMGVVVNHYTGYNLRDIMPEIETVEEIPFYLGGPVGTQMMFSVDGRIKFIVGYSGWGKDQIASELKRHDWAVLNNGGRQLLMGEGDDNQWRDAVSQFGDRYRLWLDLPSDPTNN